MAYSAIADVLRAELSPARFRHCEAVGRLAADLARRHGWNPDEAKIAGLVHDCAKEWPPAKLLGHVKRRRLAVPDLAFIRAESPNLAHAYVSADVARARGWITTAAQHRAVAAHTLGAPRMGVPEAVLFVADLASTDRRFPEAPHVRRLARVDLKAGLRAALAVKLTDHLRKNKKIHFLPVAVWNGLVGGR